MIAKNEATGHGSFDRLRNPKVGELVEIEDSTKLNADQLTHFDGLGKSASRVLPDDFIGLRLVVFEAFRIKAILIILYITEHSFGIEHQIYT